MRTAVAAFLALAGLLAVVVGCSEEPNLFNNNDCGDAGRGGAPAGSSTTSSPASSATSASSTTSSSSSSSGGIDAGPCWPAGCARCAGRFASVAVDGQLCAAADEKIGLPDGVDSALLWMQFNACACGATGACEPTCQAACIGPGKSFDQGQLSPACFACLSDRHAGCGLLFDLCTWDGNGGP